MRSDAGAALAMCSAQLQIVRCNYCYMLFIITRNDYTNGWHDIPSCRTSGAAYDRPELTDRLTHDGSGHTALYVKPA